MGFPDSSVVKNPPANAGEAGDVGLIPGLGRSSGECDNPLGYSCLENPMDQGARWATVHVVIKSYKDMHAHTHSRIKIWPLTSKTMKWHVSYKGILSFV